MSSGTSAFPSLVPAECSTVSPGRHDGRHGSWVLVRNIGEHSHRGQKPYSAAHNVKSSMLLQLDDIAIPMPEGRPLYDLKEAAPGLVQPSSEALDKLLAYGKDHLDELFAEVGFQRFQNWIPWYRRIHTSRGMDDLSVAGVGSHI